MQNRKQRGILTSWKDDKGFGFIKPDRGKAEVFIHISALKGSARRPRVGDVIFYELTTGDKGKVRACNASIQGVVSEPAARKHKIKNYKSFPNYSYLSGIATLAIFGIIFTQFRNFQFNLFLRQLAPIPSVVKPACIIKGNISQSSGNKLYHVPGMEDYENTVIDLSRGERWFCTEAEAIQNGWRRAPR